MILCSRDTAAAPKLLEISLEYFAVFDGHYTTTIGVLYATAISIPCTNVTSIHDETLSKEDTTWITDVNNLPVRSLQGILLLFLNKRDDFENKNKEFYNLTIKKELTIIN